MVMKKPALYVQLACVLLLSACGGSSSSSNSADTQAPTGNSSNTAPVADAGTNRTAAINQTIALSAVNSSDADNDSLTYLWSLDSKPQASQTELQSTNGEQVNMTPDVVGDYIIGLIVNDGSIDSAKVTITITAIDQTTNIAPVADAGPNQNTNVSEVVTLSGQNSIDPNGDLLTYVWTIESKPASSLVSLAEPNKETVTFVPDMNGQFIFSLVVNDGVVDSEKSIVTITSQANNLDITNAIFVNRSGSCADYIGTYTSTVNDIKRSLPFSGQVEILQSSDKCILNINQIPNHDFNDNSASFATNVSEVIDSFQLTTAASMTGTNKALAIGTTEGVFLNGVTIDILPAACYGVGDEPLGREKIGCGPDNNDNPWRYDPMSPLNTFGTDAHNAHTQPNGKYHYHANPMAMFDQSCGDAPSATIGFAADGYPIYGSCFKDPATGEIRKAISSYTLKDNGGPRQDVSGYQTPQAGVGGIASSNYDGQFRGDWEFTQGIGDLDECNGMTIDGQYGYYVTDSFPWVINCFKGATDTTFSAGAQLLRRSHSHPDENEHSHNGTSHSH